MDDGSIEATGIVLMEIIAIPMIYIDGAYVMAKDDRAYLTLYIDQPCIQIPGTMERVVVARVMMNTEVARDVMTATNIALAESAMRRKLLRDQTHAGH